MLGYYKRHVLGLAERLQALSGDSTTLDRLIDLQRDILSRILITEAKITGYKLRGGIECTLAEGAPAEEGRFASNESDRAVTSTN